MFVGDAICEPITRYRMRISSAAGITINEFARNLSLMRQPCVRVATTVVSLINDRLSPKNAPPTMMATSSGILMPADCATPVAIGVNATMVPTLVPMEMEIKQAAANKPASSMEEGSTDSVRPTVASTLPISFAELAKAPASTNIHSMSIMFSVLAPFE